MSLVKHPERRIDPPDITIEDCPDCDGAGYLEEGESCARCEATGMIDVKKEAKEERQEWQDRMREDAADRAAEDDENRP